MYNAGILFCHEYKSGRYIPIENGEIYYNEDVCVDDWMDEYLFRIHRKSLIFIDQENMDVDPGKRTISYRIIPKEVIQQLIEDITSRNFELCITGELMYVIENGQQKLTESGEKLISMSKKLEWMLARATEDEVFIAST